MITPVFAGGELRRLRRQPRPPRRRRRQAARQHARRLPHARRGGRRDPAAAGSDEGGSTRSCCRSPPHAPARTSAGPTCAPSSRPAAPARRALAELRRALRARHGCARRWRETLDYAERRTRARIAELEDGVREAARRARGGRRRPRAARCEPRWRATSCGSTSRGSAEQHDGNLNCPLAVTLLRLLLRGARAHRPRHAALRRRLPAGHRDRARGLAAQRPPAGRGRRRATSRPRRAWPTSCCSAFGRALGQGTMNNLTLGNERLHLLRDARRRPGRVPGRRRPERACTWRCATRSTRRSRRSSSSSRCGRSSTRCGAARAAPGATGAATAWCASSRRSPR